MLTDNPVVPLILLVEDDDWQVWELQGNNLVLLLETPDWLFFAETGLTSVFTTTVKAFTGLTVQVTKAIVAAVYYGSGGKPAALVTLKAVSDKKDQ